MMYQVTQGHLWVTGHATLGQVMVSHTGSREVTPAHDGPHQIVACHSATLVHISPIVESHLI